MADEQKPDASEWPDFIIQDDIPLPRSRYPLGQTKTMKLMEVFEGMTPGQSVILPMKWRNTLQDVRAKLAKEEHPYSYPSRTIMPGGPLRVWKVEREDT